MISSIGGYAKDEIDNIVVTKAKIVAQIPGIFTRSHFPDEVEQHSSKSIYLSQTVKSAVGRWIRQAVASIFLPHTSGFEGSNPSTEKNERSIPAIAGLEQFNAIRDILEAFEDFPILADIVEIFSKSIDVVTLTAATDTIICHFETFSAIGAVHDLFESLYQQHENICGQKAPEKPFVESLVDLGRRLLRPERELRKLRAELVLYEQKYATAVCSPISDNMAESLQPTEPSFVDEVEQVLFSGTVMEKNTLTKIFKTITERISMSWGSTVVDHPQINFPDLFIQLRAFDQNVFTSLIQGWVDNLLLLKDRPSLIKILPPFICADTIGLNTVLERINSLLNTTETGSNTAALAIETLELIAMKNPELPLLPPYVSYVYMHGFYH